MTNGLSDPKQAVSTLPTDLPRHTQSDGAARKPRVDAHGWPLVLLALVAGIFALGLGQKFFIPLVFAIFIAYTLNPLVCALERLKVPRLVATVLLFTGICAAVAVNIDAMSVEFDAILDQAPVVARKISNHFVTAHAGEAGLIQKVQFATSELEKATNQATGGAPLPRKAVPDATPAFKLREWLLLGSLSALGFIGQTIMVMFLVFFILLSGNTFKRKLVKLAPSMANKKVTVRMLGEINRSIQRYMFTLFVTNALVGVLSWLTFKFIGLDNAGAWGIAAGALHLIPYIGPTLIAVATMGAAFLQFDSPSLALVVGAASITIATLVGTLLTTWMTGKISRMNPTAVFVALLFWGWLWGISGLLLAIPIIVVVKVIAEHIAGMRILAELLAA